ncbi:MAG: acetyl-CoA decarbonylase/synthase complex subunit delta [Lentisphaerae bacterium RIFOXYC12_FULL_60_16]|nr:MAG: acetyl-CoA decarbonylase/synthase complex subunit delta [Lentisphaerae bacterium RIFOXYC12_FULL_60_16]OGV85060.1 MAG: acetyl-CoA decarbonylase/synthase complex subunit delta [Lentisphaerae bacterium RIFOXYB12_FULL_60_10]
MLADAKEKWAGAVNTLTLGATAGEGGTRTSTVTVGGGTGVPFMRFDGATPHPPVVAIEIWDREPDDWPAALTAAWGKAVKSPADWARKAVEEAGADLICLKLAGTHPDTGDRSPAEAAAVVRSVLKAVGVPLVIWGCDSEAKDNEVLPSCSQAAAGERCLLGAATEDNYKTLVAACQADGHALIGLSPIDINIAKQVNILISEMGFPLDRIVMYQTTGALGYGLEYTYSIQERGRLAALGGDKMMAMPVICMVGQEAWRAKESKATTEEQPTWGDPALRGMLWELSTAVTLLQAGSDIMVMRHPQAALGLKDMIKRLVV